MKIRCALIAIGILVATGCDRDRMPEEPFASATLRISDVSTVRLAGSTVDFSSQEIGIIGSNQGGRLVLAQPIGFPQVALAFGESMAITQVDPPSGEFDASTGMVTLSVALEVTDSEGDSAPVVMTLTTATAMGLNQAGDTVSITGSPRDPATGLVRLVGLEQIPVGFDNGGEGSLLTVEIVASLEFGSAVDGFGFGLLSENAPRDVIPRPS